MRAHGPGLGRVAASYAQPADQDDLRQEIAIAIWNALDSFRGDCSQRTFVFRIAHNRGLSHIARRRIVTEQVPGIVDRAPGPEGRVAGREEVDRLFAALRTLPRIRCRSSPRPVATRRRGRAVTTAGTFSRSTTDGSSPLTQASSAPISCGSPAMAVGMKASADSTSSN
jgi:hypothetical protein